MLYLLSCRTYTFSTHKKQLATNVDIEKKPGDCILHGFLLDVACEFQNHVHYAFGNLLFLFNIRKHMYITMEQKSIVGKCQINNIKWRLAFLIFQGKFLSDLKAFMKV